MSKTRNNTSIALTANGNFIGPIQRTNGMTTIAVTALSSRNSRLTINQYQTEAGAATITSRFDMVGGGTYMFGQPVALPFFNVTITDAADAVHAYTRVNTVLHPNNLNDHNLEFVNTQTLHTTPQGSRGNVHTGTLAASGRPSPFDGNGDPLDSVGGSVPFNCSTYGNNSVICYEDSARGVDHAIIIQGSPTTDGTDDWVVIGGLNQFIPDGFDKRYTFAGIRLAAYDRIRIFNVGNTQKQNVVCSLYSS